MGKDLHLEKIVAQKDLHIWLKPETWPVPKWHTQSTEPEKIKSYATYFAHQLRTRYTELENDFRSVFGNFGGTSYITDMITAERIVDFLHMARTALEQSKPDLLTISNTLDLVERYMVWLYPPHIAKVRALSWYSRIKDSHLKVKGNFIELLAKFAKRDSANDLGAVRALLDEVIGVWNKHLLEEQISSGLQIERLKTLRLWGIMLMLVLLLVSPLTTNFNVLKEWPAQFLINNFAIASAWITALGISIIGALGGFISGLLQVRSTRVNLTEYQESMLKLQLKPLVGVMISQVSYIFLSWQILPGITVQNVGSYFFVAFLSGFSERYFLRLLEIKAEDKMASSKRETGQPAAESHE